MKNITLSAEDNLIEQARLTATLSAGHSRAFPEWLGQMMTILTDFGVGSRLEKDDNLQGLKNLQKMWL